RHGDARASLAALRLGDGVRGSLASLGGEIRSGLLPETSSGATPAVGHGPSPMRYTRLRSHAKGGLGEVSVARDEELGREVALKEIREQHADDADSRARFVREAELTGHLEHPGVVPVYGLGVYPDGRPYYAMRFIRGEPMSDAIERFHKADEDSGRDP